MLIASGRNTIGDDVCIVHKTIKNTSEFEEKIHDNCNTTRTSSPIVTFSWDDEFSKQFCNNFTTTSPINYFKHSDVENSAKNNTCDSDLLVNPNFLFVDDNVSYEANRLLNDICFENKSNKSDSNRVCTKKVCEDCDKCKLRNINYTSGNVNNLQNFVNCDHNSFNNNLCVCNCDCVKYTFFDSSAINVTHPSGTYFNNSSSSVLNDKSNFSNITYRTNISQAPINKLDTNDAIQKDVNNSDTNFSDISLRELLNRERAPFTNRKHNFDNKACSKTESLEISSSPTYSTSIGKY